MTGPAGLAARAVLGGSFMQGSLLSACRLPAGLAAAAVALAVANPATADAVADFYKGKVVSLYSGHSAGGAYSAYAQTIKDHIAKHIPGNPTVVVQIKTGGTGRVLANWLYNVAPRDGLVFGTFHERIGLEPKVSPKGTKYDGRKFGWVGSAAKQKSVCITWKDSKVKTIQDALKMQAIVGADASAATGSVMPRMLNSMIGTKFKLIRGYDPLEVFVAMERGELDGICGYGWASLKAAKPDFIDGKKVNILLMFSDKGHPELPGVPLMMDFVTDPASRQALKLVFATQEMGRPYAAPPGVPAARLTALRRAFDATMKDPDFLAQARKRRLEIDAITGEEITGLMEELYKTDDKIAASVDAFRRPMKAGESKRKLVYVTIEAPIEKVIRKGRSVEFMVKGEKHTAKLNGRRTEVMVAGAKAKGSALKPGMTCKITYPGNFGEAKALDCK
jgi:tripartite-type tricarboxylate transporter receptor subunit TctC